MNEKIRTRQFPGSRVFLTVILAFVASIRAVAAEPAAEVRAAAYLEKLWHSNQAPGMSVVVASKGIIVFSQAFGFADLDNMVPATASTVYNMGSISKTETAVAVMQLLEQGKISLNDPIQKYVPSFPDKGSPITILHLLTHTSGIRHYRDTDFPGPYGEYSENMRPYHSLEDAIKIFKDDPLLFRPGEFYFYSSYAVDLLQGVVEKASGMGFEEYMRKYVWEPSGMLSTEFDIPDRVVPHRAKGYRVENGNTLNSAYGDLTYKFAGGGMISSTEDLVRLGVGLNHGQLLKPATLALMYKPQLNPVIEYQEHGRGKKLDFEQALVWEILKDAGGRRLVYHTGSVKGFNSCLVNYPDQDFVIADMANGNSIGSDELIAVAQFFLEVKPQPGP
jgi:serine beta-lactamase-like protein LACTB, mitochondrial